ncbi:MAG: AmpG family muropeptide MFS transporter [Rickettsiales bacterium]|nr:AmpG family muropeptide MFS transporter [Rickettsiales bacterium]
MFNALLAYRDSKILAILFLGVFSGLPLALTASTLGAWLTEAGVEKTAIGLFAAVTTPYALKFLWSPLIDATRFPVLSHLFGRRCGWLIATQIALMLAIAGMGFTNPSLNPWATAFCALLVAIASASQDIVIDAYRVELLPQEKQGAGAAAIVLGYRLGMIISAAGALYLASYVSWQMTYFLMAAFMGLGILLVVLTGEPKASRTETAAYRGNIGQWVKDAVVAPFADFMTRPHWLAILLFILLYKLGDAFMGVMTNPFLLEIGFTKQEIATVVKVYGVIATIIGSFIGGSLVFRMGTAKTLWTCGIFHMLTNLMFVAQAHIGADVAFLALSISLENISGGMGTTAFVAFMGSLTRTRFTATQYALLSSFASFGRTWLSTPAGWFAEIMGWASFFTLATALALPGLAVLWWLQGKGIMDAHAPQATPENSHA